MTTDELKICILDIETYREMIIVGGYIPHQDRWVMFEISRRYNQIDAMVKFLMEEKIDYYVGFNTVLFDSQVLQFILDSHDKWFDFTWDQICAIVYSFVQDLISNQDYEIQPPYKEQYMDIKQIDLFLILHMNNVNRRTSLKWCMYSMDEDIEIMPVDHGKENLTIQEIEETIYYWKNDIKATYTLYKYCIGETDHPDYKGKDKIQLRIDLISEFNFPSTAINWNDVKIGDELNKKNYLEVSGLTQQKLWDKVKGRKGKTKFVYKDCFPSYWKFDTKELQDFIDKIKNTPIDIQGKQEFPLIYKGTKYMLAKGGIHSCETSRMILPGKDELILDADVGSEYPNAIRKRELYPAHLGISWNKGYVSFIPRRLESKKKYKETKEKKYDNFQETFKLCLNGSFGKLIDKTNWQYDAFIGMCVTIGCQIEILMLIEDLEEGGFHVISANTDGVTCIVNKNRTQEYYKICKDWEIQVGNDILGQLEYVEYEKLIQTSVNDYIALKTADWKEIDGIFQGVLIDKPIDHKDRIKKKGSFLTSYELHKNKSKAIIPIALEKFFVQNVPVADTIRNHRGIFEFCIAKKASRDYFYRSTDRKTGQSTDLHKLIRYYCSSSGKGEKIYKRKHEHSDKTGPEVSKCESKSENQVLFNKPFEVSNWEEYGIDYKYYEDQANEIIDKILPEYKRDREIQSKKQLQLF